MTLLINTLVGGGSILESIKIRSIIEAIEQLNESTGLAGRKPGDTFKEPSSGDSLTFQQLKFFPATGGTYTPEELDAEIDKVEAAAAESGGIKWENSRSPRTGGFAIAEFGTSSGGSLLVGTYLQSIKANPVDNYISNTILKTYKFAGKAAEKTQAGLTAQDLLTQKANLTIRDIMGQLAQTLGTDNPLYHVAHHVAMGQPLPLEINAPADTSFTAFRDYFCEILQPIALHTGLYDGNAGEAAEKFLAPEGFPGTLINFDASKNAGLADSRLELPDGRYVKVSSKGDKGAEASIKNLLDSVKELELDTGAGADIGRKLRKDYAGVLELINDVQTAGQSGAPIFLGVKHGLIDSSEGQIIKGLKGAAPVDLKDTRRLKSLGLTDNLIQLARGRTTKNPESTTLYYHLIASLAHKVADIINTKTNFSDAASTILNNGALVQVYTVAKQVGKKWILDTFHTVYPGTSVTGVTFSAQKNYSSTSIKGNFTFRIMRGGPKPGKEENVDTENTGAGATDEVEPPKEKTFNPLKDKKGGGAGRARRK